MRKRARVKKTRPARRPRRAPVLGATAGACFVGGASVTEATLRTEMAADAMAADDRARMERELAGVFQALKVIRRTTPLCQATQEAVDGLVRDARRAVAIHDSSAATGALSQIRALVAVCADKLKDRCAPESIPRAR
jgi:hypothetical protein